VFARTIHAHNPKSYLTKISNFTFNSDLTLFDAKDAKFLKELRWLMGYEQIEEADNAEMQRLKIAAQKRAHEAMKFWAQFFGNCLTTLTDAQQFLYLFGLGDDGKSAITNLLTRLLGGYAGTLDESIMSSKGRNTANYHQFLYKLKGLRLALVPEMSDGRLNEAAIKNITGGDVIEARPLFQMPVSFQNKAKLVFVSNHEPNVKLAENKGMMRRLVMCRFNRIITEKKAFSELLKEWEAESDKILCWALEGLHDYLEQSKRGTADSVRFFVPADWRDALETLKEEGDNLADFLLEKSDGVNVGILQGERCSEVFSRYLDFCTRMKVEPAYHTQQSLNIALRKKGYKTEKGPQGRMVFLKGYTFTTDANGNKRLIAE
jgi:P4 family phage/plasmid primase-like protien